MLLSYECVIQNFTGGESILVGSTVEVLEADGRLYTIKRVSEEYCKVRERDVS
jgi:hypothetical protein